MKLFERLFRILDSEGVVFFQTLVYINFAASGAYCAFVAKDVPITLSQALGEPLNMLWPYMCMACMVCLGGKLLSSNPRGRRYWLHTTGLLLQLAGDVFATGAFATYVLSTLQEETWGRAVVAAWVFAALAECTFFLCWRDVRRFLQAERAVRS